MRKLRIFRCNICGSVVAILDGDTNTLACCGEFMEELFPRFEDELSEKHVPITCRIGNYVKVKIGEVEHPMKENHFIRMIIQKTNFGFKVNYLTYLEEPITEFTLSPNEKIDEVYCYCNIHGLWATKKVEEAKDKSCKK